ncbi:unnamed protein product [Ambrosiozyma monospora]|uniref:Unnamed protein product n=1 Tax=Ambrosiozyma monospora TaxID=43982 RepID=A0ACB5TL00_AMBMO|nr:unnamed protein product [Ambrosiozyma monospora]
MDGGTERLPSPSDVEVETHVVDQSISSVPSDLESLNEYTSFSSVDTVQHVVYSSSINYSSPLPPSKPQVKHVTFEQVDNTDSISCLAPLSSQYSAESDVESVDASKEHNQDRCDDWLMMQVGKNCDTDKFKKRLLQTWNAMAQDL